MEFLKPNWSAPSSILALTTTRIGGISQPPFNSFNVGNHVGDNNEHVLDNRNLLQTQLALPQAPEWLNQTHSTNAIIVEKTANRQADAAITRDKRRALAIMTADCLPIVLCDTAGTEIAAIHAGWRGLCNGIVESTLEKMISLKENLIAWIGPAICQKCFEVGHEVPESFYPNYPFTKNLFETNNEKYFGSLSLIAEMILHQAGVKRVYQSQECTYELEQKYFSYRREKETGRMVTLIWFKNNE